MCSGPRDATESKEEGKARDPLCEYNSETERKIRRAKRAARSELSVSRGEWQKHELACSDVLSIGDFYPDEVERVPAATLPVEEFVERYEKPGVPVILTGLTDDWPASKLWTDAYLIDKYGDHKFKVGSDDDGYSVRLALTDFLYYCKSSAHGRADDSPLYIFDGSFADRRTSRALRQDYSVPPYFAEDLMRYAGERRRPPYRWLVKGPARSGSGVHIDPLATCAWNALLRGHKRWALFPPDTPREKVRPPGSDREAAPWFHTVWREMLKRTKCAEPPLGGGNALRPSFLHTVQGPGETIFVPAGWWHAVLNLDDTLAVTQNYCSTSLFPRVWRHTRRGRPKMSAKWLSVLRVERPDLAAVADQLEALPEHDPRDSYSSSSSSSSDSSDTSSSSSSSSNDEDPSQEISTKVQETIPDGEPSSKRARQTSPDA